MQGQHGFHPTTSEDHRAWIWVASILSLTYSALCMAARLVGKWEMIWWDDAVLGLAYVFALFHFGMLFRSIAQGLGASISIIEPIEIAHAARIYFVSRIFSLIAQCISKLSVLIFTRRIFSGNFDNERMWFLAAYTSVTLYGVCAVMLSSAACRPQLTLLAGRDLVCEANIARWSVITMLDVITEVMLVVLPLWFISKNTIKSSKKSIIVFVFSFRLLVAVFSIASVAAYVQFFSEYSRISIGIARTVAWQEVLLGFSLMTASIPCLRTFLDAFTSTGLMTVHGRNIIAYRPPGTLTQTSHSQAQSKSQSQSQSDNTPQPQGKRKRPMLGERHSSGISRRLRPDRVQYKANVHAQNTSNLSNDQSVSSKLSRTPESVESLRGDKMGIQRNFEIRVTRSR